MASITPAADPETPMTTLASPPSKLHPDSPETKSRQRAKAGSSSLPRSCGSTRWATWCQPGRPSHLWAPEASGRTYPAASFRPATSRAIPRARRSLSRAFRGSFPPGSGELAPSQPHEGTWELRALRFGRHTRAPRRATNLVGTTDEVRRLAHITSSGCTRERLGGATNDLGRGFERPGSGEKRCWVGSPDHSCDATKGR